jgi:hypothetical protein
VKRILVAMLFALAVIVPIAPVHASGGCVTHSEYDNLVWGLSTDQVQNRFETNGWFIGYTDDNDFFKRGYPTCWSDDRKVVIFYDAFIGLTDHWDVRDR